MAKKLCDHCGSELIEYKTRYVCQYCHNEDYRTFHESDDVQLLINEAQAYRLRHDFEQSKNLYFKILERHPNSIDAHWGYLLSDMGISYVKGPRGEYLPTCHRLSFQNILKDPHYKKVLSLSDERSKKHYEVEANRIEKIRTKLVDISEHAPDYDIFISYKATKPDNESTPTVDDSKVTQLYYELEKKGYNVFMAKISLKQQAAGKEYEPYIFTALNSAKLMIVFASQKEYMTSPWVKNEWTRYFELLNQGKKHPNSLLPVYMTMSPYDFPEELKHIQGLNFEDINFKDDLFNYISVIIDQKSKKEIPSENAFEKREIQPVKKVHTKSVQTLEKHIIGQHAPSIVEVPINVKKNLENGYVFLNNQLYSESKKQFEMILKEQPHNFEAQRGVLFSSLEINDDFFDYPKTRQFNVNILGFNPSDLISALDLVPKDQGNSFIDHMIQTVLYVYYSDIDVNKKFEFLKEALSVLFMYLSDDQIHMIISQIMADFAVVQAIGYKHTKALFHLFELMIKPMAAFDEENVFSFYEKIINMLAQLEDFKYSEIVIQRMVELYGLTPSITIDLLRNELKARSTVAMIETIITRRKFQLVEEKLKDTLEPERFIQLLLEHVYKIDSTMFEKKAKHTFQFIDLLLSYLPNFSEASYIEYLLDFGKAKLAIKDFRGAKKYFNEILRMNPHHIDALWYLILVENGCQSDQDVIDKNIQLIKYDEYKRLIGLPDDTAYYTALYVAIQNGHIDSQLKAQIDARKHPLIK